jgi:hypothetical protein
VLTGFGNGRRLSTSDTSLELSPMASNREVPLHWLDLEELSKYAPFSRRTLGEWIRRPDDPLPAYQIGVKLVVNRDEFDAYIRRHRVKVEDINRIIEELVEGMKNGS